MTNCSLENKIALITGASYGIGFAIATAYAKAGATICFNDLSQENVDKGIAGPAVFLASDASNFVNGHVLYVDGGILAYIGKKP